MWGTLTDISAHGCYVEMSNTYPADTPVYLVLKSCGIRIQAPGTVRASYPGLGMGIRFAEIEPEQQAQLQQLLAMLAGRSPASNRGTAQETVVGLVRDRPTRELFSMRLPSSSGSITCSPATNFTRSPDGFAGLESFLQGF